ncbi:hypothetical protein BC829DRAFT_401406 [Chytridium lagenaria]|nr:hypothetical protein BC829DRAFT_401406 [Chytridium lagenaria]
MKRMKTLIVILPPFSIFLIITHPQTSVQAFFTHHKFINPPLSLTCSTSLKPISSPSIHPSSSTIPSVTLPPSHPPKTPSTSFSAPTDPEKPLHPSPFASSTPLHCITPISISHPPHPPPLHPSNVHPPSLVVALPHSSSAAPIQELSPCISWVSVLFVGPTWSHVAGNSLLLLPLKLSPCRRVPWISSRGG